MSNQEIRGILIDEAEHGQHGDFLRAFIDAVLRADPVNFELLKPAAETLIQKYGLKKRHEM